MNVIDVLWIIPPILFIILAIGTIIIDKRKRIDETEEGFSYYETHISQCKQQSIQEKCELRSITFGEFLELFSKVKWVAQDIYKHSLFAGPILTDKLEVITPNEIHASFIKLNNIYYYAVDKKTYVQIFKYITNHRNNGVTKIYNSHNDYFENTHSPIYSRRYMLKKLHTCDDEVSYYNKQY